jgi:hypothetical protein
MKYFTLQMLPNVHRFQEGKFNLRYVIVEDWTNHTPPPLTDLSLSVQQTFDKCSFFHS